MRGIPQAASLRGHASKIKGLADPLERETLAALVSVIGLDSVCTPCESTYIQRAAAAARESEMARARVTKATARDIRMAQGAARHESGREYAERTLRVAWRAAMGDADRQAIEACGREIGLEGLGHDLDGGR